MGAPLDSSGSGRGESRAPAALRRAGLAERLGARNLGDVTPPITDSTRDPQSGVIGFAELRQRSLALADVVAGTLGRGERPLVLGGDCCVLLGVFVGLRQAGRDAGLWFVDGHADFYHGRTSPSGEAADMELAMLTGRGPEGIVDLGGTPPLVAAERVMILGHRRPEDHEAVRPRSSATCRRRSSGSTRADRTAGAGRGGSRCRSPPGRLRFGLAPPRPRRLDGGALPALTYPQPGGLSWNGFIGLVRPLADSAALVGVSVADFQPDRDPDGVHAAQVVDGLMQALG